MAVIVKLHSDATTARSDFTGEPSQVYENSSSAAWIITQIRAKNALTIFRVDNNCHWLHIMAPHIINDIYDNPEWIVGNCSDVLGEYRLVKIHVTKLRYFAIMGEGNLLPVNPEMSESIEPSHLRGGALRRRTRCQDCIPPLLFSGFQWEQASTRRRPL